MASVAVWTGSGAIAAVGESNHAVATWAGSGAFVGNVSTPVGPTTAALAGHGNLTWRGNATAAAVASLAGAGVFTGDAVGGAPGVATWSGTGILSLVGESTAASVAVITGSGALAWIKFANAPTAFTMTAVGKLEALGEFNVPQINPFWSVPINGNIVAFVAYNWVTRQMFVGYEDQSFTLLDNIGLGAATQIRTAAPNAEAMVLALVAGYGG